MGAQGVAVISPCLDCQIETLHDDADLALCNRCAKWRAEDASRVAREDDFHEAWMLNHYGYGPEPR